MNVKVTATTEAKAKLADELISLLFPAPVRIDEEHWRDGGIDDLAGALIDIRRLWINPDEVCLTTIELAVGKLQEARRLIKGTLGNRMP